MFLTMIWSSQATWEFLGEHMRSRNPESIILVPVVDCAFFTPPRFSQQQLVELLIRNVTDSLLVCLCIHSAIITLE